MRTNNRTAAKVMKALSCVILIPLWLVAGAVSLLAIGAGWVAGRGIIRWALRIIIGALILYGLISGLWGASAIIGVPAVFLYVFPYIASGISTGCTGIMGAISDYIRRPAGVKKNVEAYEVDD